MKGHCAVDVNKQYLYAFSHIHETQTDHLHMVNTCVAGR